MYVRSSYALKQRAVAHNNEVMHSYNTYSYIMHFISSKIGYILRSRIARLGMRPIAADGEAWSVCRLVGPSVRPLVDLSVTVVSPAKADVPIEMPFGMCSRVR